MHDVYNPNDRTFHEDYHVHLESYTLEEMEDKPEPEYLIEGLMIAGGVYCVAAAPGVGKSWLEQKIAMAVGMGRPFHGRATKKGTVVRLISERFGLVPKRLRDDRARHPEDAEARASAAVHHFPETIELDNPLSVERLIGDLERKGISPTLLTIDTLAMNIAEADENSAGGMGRVVKGLQMLRKRLGCTILVVHHTSKGGKSERGSNALTGFVDGMWLMRKHGADKLAVRSEKENWTAGFAPMLFRLVTEDQIVTLEEVRATTDSSGSDDQSTARNDNLAAAEFTVADESFLLERVRSNGGITARKSLVAEVVKADRNRFSRNGGYNLINGLLARGLLVADGRLNVRLPGPAPAGRQR
jgi:hypothetical protein